MFKLLRTPSVALRLVAGFSVVVGFLIAVATVNAVEFQNMGAVLRNVVEVNNPKSARAYELLNQINELAIRARSIAMLTEAKEIDAEVVAFKATELAYAKSERELVEIITAAGATDAETQLLAAIAGAAKQATPLIRRAVEQGVSGANLDANTTLMAQVRPVEQAWRKNVLDLVALEDEISRSGYADAKSRQARTFLVASMLILAAVLLSGLVAWRIIASVKNPIDQLIGAAERIARGDLSTPVPAGAQDEFGRLLGAMSAMQERLRELVGEIRTSADSIQVASSEVASGNKDLSHRTEMASSSLQQTASSMEELTETVRGSAQAASKADELANSASQVAAHGGTVVGQVVATMQQINDSSQRISEIITVIDGIAFQTNILALNAAVEAARAGDQGRGFAVVAGEVRALAQRSAAAAKEIKQLIGTSVSRVEAGSKLVGAAGKTMTGIVESVERVSGIIKEITVASGEQARGISQINQTVTQLDRMTQQNAALVEQSAASAESMREQADRLTVLVAAFQLESVGSAG